MVREEMREREKGKANIKINHQHDRALILGGVTVPKPTTVLFLGLAYEVHMQKCIS